MRRFLAPVLLLAGVALAQETGYNTNWSGHRTLHVNTGVAGTSISANVLRFPTLVRLTAADSAVFAASKGNGADIRFTKSNNTARLHHQIDRWDSAARKAEVWVLLDTVYANSNTQTFRMHWGNAGAADSSKASAVFDSANGFIAAWHMGTAGDSLLPRPNAVAGGNAATPMVLGLRIPGAFPKRVEGVIGYADTLRRGTGTTTGAKDSSEHFNIGAGYNAFNGQHSISAWIYQPISGSSSDWNQFVSLGNGQAIDNIWMGREGGTTNFISEVYGSGTNHMRGGTVTAANWNHLTWTIQGLTSRMYVNGVLAATLTSSTAIKDTLRSSNFIGRSNWADRNVFGKFDEVRISKVARSANWIALEYANQNAAQTLVTASSAPSISYTADSVSVEAGFPITAVTPASTGGTPFPSYSIAPAIGNGLSFNTTTGAITGTPTAAAAKTKYTVTVTNANGTATDSIWITVTAPAVNEDYSTWTSTKTLNLNGAALGITAAVSRIPVLVRLTSADSAIFAAGRASLRFSKPDGSRLKYSIDSWDSTGRTAAVWVLFDNVGTGNNTLRLHWGKVGAVSQSSGPSVFEPANGYIGVYHMGNPVDTSAAATSPRPNMARPGFNNATPVNLTTISPVKPGVIGMADSLPGLGGVPTTASGFSIDTLQAGTFPSGNLTFSAWMQQGASGSLWRSAISVGNTAACCGNVTDGVLMGTSGSASRAWGYQVATRVGTDGNPAWPTSAANALDTNVWYYVALSVRAGTTGNNTMYVNGAPISLSTAGGDREVRDTVRTYNSLGRNVFTNDAPLRGKLDEARLANVARSNDWFKVEYATQRPGVATVSNIAYTVPANFTPGTAIAAVNPVVSGTATKYSVSPALPAGLVLDSVTGVLSGTPTVATGTKTYTVTATNGPWTATANMTFSAVSGDGAYATAWSGHRFVNVNTSNVVTPNTALLLKFPMLVRLGAADSAIFNASQATGADIRFTRLNNTSRLQHEIDSWDKANKRAAIWVLVDTVYGASTGSRFMMHYGNANVADSSKASAVFDSANYAAVFHLGGENGTVARPNAVPGGNAATPANFQAGYAPSQGIIGWADSLGVDGNDAEGSHLSFGPMPVGTVKAGRVSYSLWVKKSVFTGWRHTISIGSGAPNNNFWFGHPGNEAGALRVRTAEGTTERDAVNAPAFWTDNQWQLVHVTFDGSAVKIYGNGAQAAEGNIGHTLADVARTSAFIGRALWPDPKFLGVYDEVRVTKSARTAPWVKLEYENQKPASAVVTTSATLQPIVVGLNASALLASGPALGIKRFGQGLMFQVRSDVASKVRISIVDVRGSVVWNHTAATAAGMNQVAWNGVTNNGQTVGSGVFAVRMSLLDENGKEAASLVRRVPLTR